jgi:hypothetical protein
MYTASKLQHELNMSHVSGVACIEDAKMLQIMHQIIYSTLKMYSAV